MTDAVTLRVVTFNLGCAQADPAAARLLLVSAGLLDPAGKELPAEKGDADSASSAAPDATVLLLQEATAEWERLLRGLSLVRRTFPYACFKRCSMTPPWGGGAAILSSVPIRQVGDDDSKQSASGAAGEVSEKRLQLEVSRGAGVSWEPSPVGWYHALKAVVVPRPGCEVHVLGVHLRPPVNDDGLPTPLASLKSAVSRRQEWDAFMERLAPPPGTPFVVAGCFNENPAAFVRLGAMQGRALVSVVQSAAAGEITWKWPLSRLGAGFSLFRNIGPSDCRDDVIVSEQLAVEDGGVIHRLAGSDGTSPGQTHRPVWATLSLSPAPSSEAVQSRRHVSMRSQLLASQLMTVLGWFVVLLLAVGIVAAFVAGRQSSDARRYGAPAPLSQLPPNR